MCSSDLVAAGRLDEIVPLEPAAMPGRSVVQWDKDDCADLGLIKIDLLGLGMMAALEEAIPLVREAEGVEIDLARLPHDDPVTWDMIGRADLIDTKDAVDHWKAQGLDFSSILYRPEVGADVPVRRVRMQDHGLERALDQQLLPLAAPADRKSTRLNSSH